MKKALLISVLISVCCIAQSQEKIQRHEVFVSYGLFVNGHFPEYKFPFNKIVTYSDTAPYSMKNEKFKNDFTIGYLFYITRYLAIGATYSKGSADADIVLGTSLPLGNLRKPSTTTWAGTIKYKWLKWGDFSFYSRVAFGSRELEGSVPYLKNKLDRQFFEGIEYEGERCFAWQVLPLGVDWHFWKHFALFAEGGFGNMGVLHGGIKATF